MTTPPLYSLVLGLVQCVIPPYAFRLTRVFGTKRVGWVLFSVFSLMALLQVVRGAAPTSWGSDPNLALDLLYFLIPILLLIGMVHIETLFKERLRLEAEEKKLRAGLQLKVQERTAELDAVNDELRREISLRRQGGEELRKSKEQYRFLFEENPQPMWIYDLEDSKFLAFNSATLRSYGYEASELREMRVQEFWAADHLDRFMAVTTRSGAGAQHRGLWQHRRKDGSIMEVEVTCLDLIYASHQARLVLAHDVTAQRLLQKQLLQSQKMQVTTQLAGGVVDNFSRLITQIEQDANELLEKTQEAAAVATLKRVAATAASADGLTRQLMALVRRHPMQPEPLDLNKFLEAREGKIARLLGAKISLETICRANLPCVFADPGLIDQILDNLVLNGRDAMPDGGVLTIHAAALRIDEDYVREHEEARPGAFVCLTVADTGCGMTPEVHSRLFEPFFTTKSAGKSAGLGLATVHGLIKQHAGWVEVQTQPGGGSKFLVFFPCGPAPRAEKTEGSVTRPAQQAAPAVTAS